MWMKSVAGEINQAETAFLVQVGPSSYSLRWFTPTIEVDLCGHATLASSLALWHSERESRESILHFETRSGTLKVRTAADKVWLDFPTIAPRESAVSEDFGQTWSGHNDMDWFLEFSSEQAVLDFEPDFPKISGLGLRGLIITARSERYDYISRFFAPQSGVDEDSVTGSAHCALAPYWSTKLGRESLVGYQASRRGGIVSTVHLGDRVELGGAGRVVVEGILL
jgi:predicted PhzF superfamily epimerase YddE/YHI9